MVDGEGLSAVQLQQAALSLHERHKVQRHTSSSPGSLVSPACAAACIRTNIWTLQLHPHTATQLAEWYMCSAAPVLVVPRGVAAQHDVA